MSSPSKLRRNFLAEMSGGSSGSSSTNGSHQDHHNQSSSSLCRGHSKLFGIIAVFTIVYLSLNFAEQMGMNNLESSTSRANNVRDNTEFYLHKKKSEFVMGGYAPVVPKGDEAVPVKDDKPVKKNTTSFILTPDNEFTPKIAWLMSFPNSGTSYTMTMVERASNKSFATNYGDEVTHPDALESISIYPNRQEGPFWDGLSGKMGKIRELPKKYVLTKTHCGSRCVQCGPDQYIESAEIFMKRCATGHARVPPKRKRIDVEYPPDRVWKAIHLIRNPFHNIIARFHLEHGHYVRNNQTKWMAKHPNNAEGLHAWCHDLDVQYRDNDKEYFGKSMDRAALSKMLNVSCHGEFYKYTQWHNLAHETVDMIRERHHDLPVLTVHYEDYTNKFNATVTEILNFLELEHVGVLREFKARSDYGSYFTKEQRDQVKSLVRGVASERTWSQVKHYFD